jgi:hypothetical protein
MVDVLYIYSIFDFTMDNAEIDGAHPSHTLQKRSPSSPSRLAYRNKQAQLLRAIEGLGNRIDGLQERLHRAFEHELPGARWGT